MVVSIWMFPQSELKQTTEDVAVPHSGWLTVLWLTRWVCGANPSMLERKESRLTKLVAPNRLNTIPEMCRVDDFQNAIKSVKRRKSSKDYPKAKLRCKRASTMHLWRARMYSGRARSHHESFHNTRVKSLAVVLNVLLHSRTQSEARQRVASTLLSQPRNCFNIAPNSPLKKQNGDSNESGR